MLRENHVVEFEDLAGIQNVVILRGLLCMANPKAATKNESDL